MAYRLTSLPGGYKPIRRLIERALEAGELLTGLGAEPRWKSDPPGNARWHRQRDDIYLYISESVNAVIYALQRPRSPRRPRHQRAKMTARLSMVSKFIANSRQRKATNRDWIEELRAARQRWIHQSPAGKNRFAHADLGDMNSFVQFLEELLSKKNRVIRRRLAAEAQRAKIKPFGWTIEEIRALLPDGR